MCHCGNSPCASPRVSPCVTSLSTTRITTIVSKAFHPDHMGTRQLASNSLSRQRLQTSPQVPTATCNNFHLTWKWLMGPSSILTSMSMDYHMLPHTSSRMKWWTTSSWHNFWRHLSTAQDCNDCPATYMIVIIIEKVKMST